MNQSLRTRILATSITALLALSGTSARAASQLWDITPGNTTSTDGNGTWTTGAGNWTTITTANNYATVTVVAYDQIFSNGDIAVFSAGQATPTTVTVNGSVQVTALAFMQNARYTITGGTIDLTGGTIYSNFGGGSITSLPIAAINSSITGSAGLTWNALGSLALSGTNTYTGTTTFGSQGNGTVNTLKLDFSVAGAPSADILYNGAGTAGPLVFTEPGGHTSSVFSIQGAASGTNSQRLGNVTVGSTATGVRPLTASLTVASGASNTTNLTVGTIARTGVNKTLAVIGPASGTITAANANGLIGTWTTYASADGLRGGWAGITGNVGSGGTVGVFTGDLLHTTGTTIGTLGGYATTSNLTIAQTSTGNVTQAAGTTQLNSISMTDTTADRTVAIGAGNTLRLGETGGVQVVAGARSLVIGTPGDAGTLTTGNASVAGPPATSDLLLTNMSSAGTLTINSAIANNGANATNDVVNVVLNGTGRVILAGANTYTGTTTVQHGVLAVQSNGALGTSAGGLTVMNGAELQLSGNITLADAVTAGGLGINNTGAIHNISGNNTITNTITLGAPGNGGLANRFVSDSGTLTIDVAGGTPITSGVVGGNGTLHISGAGDIVIKNRLQTGAGSTTKEGTGTLFLDGDNNLVGGLIVNGGKVRVSRVNGIAVSNGAHTLNDGQLEITNLTAAADVHNLINFRSTTPGRATLLLTPGTGTLAVNIGSYTRAAGSTLDYTTAAGATLNTVSLNTNGILSGGFTVDKSSWATSGVVQTTGISWVNSTDTITATGLTNGAQISFSTTAPGGLSTNTAYYVVNSTGSSFQVSATLGGAAVALTSDGSTAILNQAGAITGLATGSYSTTFTSNANVDVAAGTTTQGTVTVNSLRFNNAGTADLSLSNTLTLANVGGILVTSAVGANDVTLRSDSAAARTLNGVELVIHQNNDQGRLIFGTAGNPLNLSSTVTTLTKTGAGEVVFRGTASNSAGGGMNARIFEGTFTIDGSERFTGSNNVNFGIGSSTTTAKVVFGNGAAVGSETINTITPGALAGSSVVGGGSALYTLTLNNSGPQDLTNLKFGGAGANENNLALTFVNTGTTILGAANTYTGATTVNAGTVIVSGSLSGTSRVTVASTATLSSGSNGGSITTGVTTGKALDISGTLSPGDIALAPITLTLDGTSQLNFNAGSTLRLDVAAAGLSDRVIFGGLTADRLLGANQATLALFGLVDYASTYTVFANVSTAGFSFAAITGYDSGNYTAVFAQTGSDYQLSFVAVPEPGSLISLLGGLGLLAGAQRFRRTTRRQGTAK